MIGNALRVQIDEFSIRLHLNPLWALAESRQVGTRLVSAYLQSIHFLVQQTPVCLELARRRSDARGMSSLSAFYANKLGEEEGHDRWAEEDLKSVARASPDSSTRLAGSPEPLESMVRLVDYVKATIERDPCLYLAYILFAEHFTVRAGPEWLRLLEENCNVPRSAMTVISHHVELDQQHVEEALDQIDELVGDPAKLPELRDVLVGSMAHFETFCAELATHYAEGIPDERSSGTTLTRTHAPAA